MVDVVFIKWKDTLLILIVIMNHPVKTKILLFLTAFAMVAFSCGGKSDEEKNAPDITEESAPIFSFDKANYISWQTYIYRKIKIIYSPDNPFQEQLENMASGYDFALRKNSQFFGIDVPGDTVVIYYYKSHLEGEKITGSFNPFVDDARRIHFWQPNRYAPVLTEYMLPFWQEGEPRFLFLKHGLMALLDYSNRNYHKVTQSFIDDTAFIPLEKLAVDTVINSHVERYQSAIAASFVDFLIYYYGIGALEKLYIADDSFDVAVARIFSITPDSLQVLWLNLVKTAVGDETDTKSRTPNADSINKE